MDIETVFPEIESIDDDTLRTGVASAWTTAAGINGLDVEDLPELPWLPSAQRELEMDADDALLVEHVRDVTSCAVGLAESLLARNSEFDIDLDIVIAGALVHDVSKPYEFDGMETTEVGELLGHPHYGVAVVSRANLPVEIAHIVLSHSSRTAVEPAMLEAEIVRRADEVVAAGIRSKAVDDLRET
jgi:putative nucleotidyltransferase with HDIG domain